MLRERADRFTKILLGTLQFKKKWVSKNRKIQKFFLLGDKNCISKRAITKTIEF